MKNKNLDFNQCTHCGMFATVWQILNMKFMQWPETEIIWICWNLLGKNPWNHFKYLFTCNAWFCRQLLAMDFKSLPDQIKLLGWLTHTLLGLKKKKFVKLIDYTYACNSLTNFEYIEGACNDRKRKFDQIKLLGWLTHTLLGLKKKESWFFNALSVKWNSWKIDKVVLFLYQIDVVVSLQCNSCLNWKELW